MFGRGGPARFGYLVLLVVLLAARASGLSPDDTSGRSPDLRPAGGTSYEPVSYRGGDHFKVFLDVGHGGYDPGGTGPDGLPESFVNLEVAKHVAQILRSHGISVELDRSGNRFVSLSERVALANASKSDLFVGLYCNASSDRSVHGTTTYYYHPGSYKLARYLENRVATSLGLANDGVVRDDLYVIKYTTTQMPDVLIEYAYISNLHEEHLLSQPSFRLHIASAVANAISGYLLHGGRGAAPRRAARIDSIASTNGTVKIDTLGKPTVGSFTVEQDGSTYFIVTFTEATLSGPSKNLRVGPPFSGDVSVVQYTLNPNVVHVAVREDYPNSYQISVEPAAEGRFTTTIYPVAN